MCDCFLVDCICYYVFGWIVDGLCFFVSRLGVVCELVWVSDLFVLVCFVCLVLALIIVVELMCFLLLWLVIDPSLWWCCFGCLLFTCLVI